MPAFYTHARFGKEVLEGLNTELQKRIMPYRDLFEIGLQGPDILFYYKGYSSNYINKIGHALHKKSGKEFFQPARTVMKQVSNEDAAFSYIAGFICHFTLDSQCHPYIMGTVEPTTGVSHTEIEAEIDRYLMIQDKKDYLRYLGVEEFNICAENAEVIASFFQELTQEDISKALSHMRLFSKLFRAPGKVKRWVVRSGLKLAGQFDDKAGLIVNVEENPVCYESTREVVRLCKEAVSIAERLIEEFQVAVEQSDVELDSRYLKTFEK